MLHFFSTYAYFTFSLVLLGLFGLGMYAFPSQRRPMILAGVISGPGALYQSIFVPEYWEPVQLFRFLAGPEDLIFLVSMGGLGWLIVPVLYGRRTMQFNIRPWRITRAYVGFTVIFLGVWLTLWNAGMHVLRAELVATAAVVLTVLVLRLRFWPLVVIGPLLFGLPYTVLLSLGLWLHPEFLGQWNLNSLTGLYVLGIPIEETAWAFSYGAAWPLLLVYHFDLRLLKATRTPTGSRGAIVNPMEPS